MEKNACTLRGYCETLLKAGLWLEPMVSHSHEASRMEKNACTLRGYCETLLKAGLWLEPMVSHSHEA